jgi:hypothetical protein
MPVPHAKTLAPVWRSSRRRPRTAPSPRTPAVARPDQGSARLAPWRVYLSHGPDLRMYPVERSFAAAAEAAVARAGHAVIDAVYFAPQDRPPHDHSALMLARSDVYVGILGRRSARVMEVPDPEHEFDCATALHLPRLVFLVEWDPPAERSIRQSVRESTRMEAFRRRVKQAGITVGSVASPDRLELLLYQALVELGTE